MDVTLDTELTGEKMFNTSKMLTLEEVNETQGVEKPTFLLNHVKELLWNYRNF